VVKSIKNSTIDLLRLCALEVLTADQQNSLVMLVHTAVDWKEFLCRVNREGLGPLAYSHLKGLKDQIPPSVIARLKEFYLKTAALQACVEKEIQPFLSALEENSLPVFVVKGKRLAHTAYGVAPHRPFVDVDLLMAGSLFSRLLPFLKKMGYRRMLRSSELEKEDPSIPFWTYRPVYAIGRLLLEFHFSFPSLQVPVEPDDDLHMMSRRVGVGGAGMKILSPEHELCLLCGHAQQHSYSRLIWLADLVRLIENENPDWTRVLLFSRKIGMDAPLYWGLKLASRLRPEIVPSAVLNGFRLTWTEKKLLALLWPERDVIDLRKPLHLPMYGPVMFSLLRQKKLSSAFRMLGRMLFPPPYWIAHYYGISLRSPALFCHYLWRISRPFFVVVEKIFHLR